MLADDLNKPLGLKPPRRPFNWAAYRLPAIGVVAIIALGAVVWIATPGRQGPTVTAVIDAPAEPPPVAVAERTGSVIPPAAGISEVAPTGSLTEVGKVVIHNPADGALLQLAALPNAALLEETADGFLPRIAEDGTRPLDAYARPNTADAAASARIAIVIGGIGLDDASTRQAIAALPGSVTLAFAPYGESLAGTLSDARAAGHEILLQIPLEPFNYPKTDPGPNTLTADASAAENIERLHWFLGRLTNYVGVVNYMGGRFTGEARALQPVMDEIGGRGLLYLDDGSSSRSKAAETAAGPFLRADAVLDADLSAAAIDEKLRQVMAIARERGFAIATATAFPVTIDRVAAFVRAAADKGVAIVPVSALVRNRS